VTRLSELDTARFGVRVAKSSPASEEEWRAALDFCREHAVELLIARIDARHMALAQRMEQDGAFLADVLVGYRASPVAAPEASDKGIRSGIRSGERSDAEAVKALARRCFQSYVDHYHADPRLPREACDEVYADWAHSACIDRKVADEVLVAEEGGRLVGFSALRLVGPDSADGMLFGVAPEARGRGVFTALLAAFLRWAAARKARSATYSTQLQNPATHKALARFGFVLESSHLTFHHWLQSTRQT
jgi:GNAT superfamily N-acetyltransferase